MTKRPVLIAGAGIAGLSVALALARAGFDTIILEQRADASEIGAGIQLGPNATRLLANLGVADRLRPLVVAPEILQIGQGKSGRPLAELPLGSLNETHGSPYWTVARADLHAALRDRVIATHRVDIRENFMVESVVRTALGAIAVEASGEQVSGMALIGCDGLWSHVRDSVAPEVYGKFAGKTAWRAMLPTAVSSNSVNLWLAPDAHLVHYPVASGHATNLIAIIGDDDLTPAWDREADPAVIRARFADWAEPVRTLIGKATVWRKWPLYDMQPLPRLSIGPVTLAGDAAHPVLPFLAQGAGLAIEDAVVLARALSAAPGNPASAFAVYEQSRRLRAAKLANAARANGRTYHLDGVTAAARDLILRRTPARLLLSRYDWLYGYRADEIALN